MNPSAHSPNIPPGASEDEWRSALFAQLVLQQTNMAMMLLGKMPHPETGQTVRDLDAAKLFIDQLEMLQAKTRGNLNKGEESLLKQSLMSLHLAFVEAVESPELPAATEPAKATDSAKLEESAKPTVAESPSPAATESPGAATAATEGPHKRFTKKY